MIFLTLPNGRDGDRALSGAGVKPKGESPSSTGRVKARLRQGGRKPVFDREGESPSSTGRAKARLRQGGRKPVFDREGESPSSTACRRRPTARRLRVSD